MLLDVENARDTAPRPVIHDGASHAAPYQQDVGDQSDGEEAQNAA